MENGVSCILGYSLKISLCQRLFLGLQVPFSLVGFFSLQTWAGGYNLCLLDGLLEIYLE